MDNNIDINDRLQVIQYAKEIGTYCGTQKNQSVQDCISENLDHCANMQDKAFLSCIKEDVDHLENQQSNAEHLGYAVNGLIVMAVIFSVVLTYKFPRAIAAFVTANLVSNFVYFSAPTVSGAFFAIFVWFLTVFGVYIVLKEWFPPKNKVVAQS
jgi:hypothetical protein